MIAAIDIEHLLVIYGTKPVLVDINCTIPQGVLCGLIGPNGAGKTTLLKTIVGLVTPTQGCIALYGKAFNDVRPRVAYVPQRMLVDWDFPVTVFDVVMMGRYQHIGWFWRPSVDDKQRVYKAIESVGMSDYIQSPIGALSGGQQQRTFIARALVQDADMYIMDEPFAGIDMVTENLLVDLLGQLQKAGKTVVIVHHDLHSASFYFDWVVLLNRKIIACGKTSEVLTELHVARAYRCSE